MQKGRDIIAADAPNPFIQTTSPKDGEKVIMKIAGVSVDLLVQECPTACGQHTVHKNGEKVSCVVVLKGIHGTLISTSLFHKQLRTNTETSGFDFNVCCKLHGE